ncbi:MAG: AAA family ATPase, partial [Dehalococcoidia bacterium]
MVSDPNQLPEGTVTVLFTDVEGSTDLSNRLGDEAARDLLRSCEDLIREQVARHRGHEVKGLGDGLMVAFQSARRAVTCAQEIQRALDRRAVSEHAQTVRVRIGLHTGEVIREAADLFGATVNAAARVAGSADADEILVSEMTKGLLGAADVGPLVDRGEVALKGFPEPWRLFAVPWRLQPGAAVLASTERTPFVGREEERGALRRLLDQAMAGRGALALLAGEAGVGKTRLAEELAGDARARGFRTWIGHCYDAATAPYGPFVEILESALREMEPDAFREVLADGAAEAAKLLPQLRRTFPDIPEPIELPPQQERQFLLNNLRDVFERLAGGQPLLLVVEDLHWADEATLALLQHLASRVGEMPLVVVGAYRDVEVDPSDAFAATLQELNRQRSAQRFTLRPLDEGAVAAMLRARSGQEPPASLVATIHGETEGNPFFVEEVFEHLAEEGRLFDDEGRWRSDVAISEEDVPEGVRLVIGRRLERLSDECRRALGAGATIGRRFAFEFLQAVVDVDEEALLDAVDEAERARLVSSFVEGGEARFSFGH